MAEYKKLSLRKKIGLKLFRQYRHNEARIHNLNYILWESTLACNLNCLHCGSDCKTDSNTPNMPAKDFLRAIDEIIPIVNPNKTMVTFTGGECLLRKDLEIVGMELYNRGFPWGIVSNGLLLNAQRLQSLLNAGLRSISISLDGLETSHNWLRNSKQSFQKALNAGQLIAQIPDLAYDVVTCVNRMNIGELDQIKELLIKNKIKNWRLFTIFPIGRAAQNKYLQLQPNEFKFLFDYIATNRKLNEINITYGCEGYLGNYEKEVRSEYYFCRAGINYASILADGSISACPNLRENFIQGNIYEDNFRDVWENQYSLHRNREWARTGECTDCKDWKYCEGNGLHLRDASGKLLFCHLKRIKEGADSE